MHYGAGRRGRLTRDRPKTGDGRPLSPDVRGAVRCLRQITPPFDAAGDMPSRLGRLCFRSMVIGARRWARFATPCTDVAPIKIRGYLPDAPAYKTYKTPRVSETLGNYGCLKPRARRPAVGPGLGGRYA
jgi:hypothetical protein